MTTTGPEERESQLISKLLRVTLLDEQRDKLAFLAGVSGELGSSGSKPLLSVSCIDEVFIERLSLSDLPSLKEQLKYLVSVHERVDEEANRSAISAEGKTVCSSLDGVLRRYVAMAIQCPELFGHPSASLSAAGSILSSMLTSNDLSILVVIKVCDWFASEAGAEAACEFASPLLLQIVQRIITLRSFDICGEQASGDVNSLALFFQVSKHASYVSSILVKSPLFFPPALPAPMKLPGQQTTTPTHKNVFALQTGTLLGRLLMPSTVDHVLLQGGESAKHRFFHNLTRRTMPDFSASVAQARALLANTIDSTLSIVQPLVRVDEPTRLAVLHWFACAIKESASRSSMGWQQQMAPHGAQLAEHLVSGQGAAQLGGSLEKFRSLTNMQSVRFGGLLSSGTSLNLAWTIFELCKPIKLVNCGGVDEFFMASTNPVVVQMQAALASEARLGDSDRLASIQSHLASSTTAGSFKSQIFWLAVNAVHTLVLPSTKETETAVQCASVFHRDKKDEPMNDAYGEFHCFESVFAHPRFVESLAHVINLMLVMILRSATGAQDANAKYASEPFEGLDIRHSEGTGVGEGMSDSMAVLPACMMEEIVELLDFYRLMRDVSAGQRGLFRDITDMLDPDLFLLFTIWTLGSEKVKNPSIRGKAAKVLVSLTKDPRFASRIERAPYAVRNITPACIRVFSAVEKTRQSYYDIRMHVKFELRIPIQQLFEQALNLEEHRKDLRGFVSEFRDEFFKFVSQLLNDTTYLLEEGLDTLISIRKKEAAGIDVGVTEVSAAADGAEAGGAGAGGSSGSAGGTAGLGVERGVEQDDQNEQGEDMYRRSRHDPTEHCRQYMRMGHQTMNTLHQMCRQTCDVMTDDKGVLDQMIASCLDPCLNWLVGPKCLELKSAQKSKYDFALFEFDPKKLLYQILEMYVFLSDGSELKRDRVAKALSDDQRYYRPETLRKAITIARREHLVSPEMLKKFEELARFTNEFANNQQSAMDSVEVPDEFLDPIMAEIMADPVLLPTSHNVMDRRHIMRIIMSDDHDPFNRQPLKPADLLPQPELKARIHEFCRANNIPLDKGDDEPME